MAERIHNMDNQERLIGTITLFDKLSDGTFDPWALSGRSNAAKRANLMSMFEGVRVPQNKSGVNIIRTKLHEAMGICRKKGETIRSADIAFVKACKEMVKWA